MPLPIVPAMLGSKYTDAATAQEIETHSLSNYISDKAAELKSAARDSLSDVVNGVMRVVNKALPAAIAATASLQYRGTQGSFLSYIPANNIVIKYKFFQISADNSDLIGYPTHAANSLLSNYSGFVLCENAVISIGGTVIEEQAIEDLLNAGVFIE